MAALKRVCGNKSRKQKQRESFEPGLGRSNGHAGLEPGLTKVDEANLRGGPLSLAPQWRTRSARSSLDVAGGGGGVWVRPPKAGQ